MEMDKTNAPSQEWPCAGADSQALRLPAKLGCVRVKCFLPALAAALLVQPWFAPPALGQTTDSTPRAPSPSLGWPEAKGFALTLGLGGLAYLADQSARDAVRGSGPQGSQFLKGVAAYGNAFGQPVALGAGVLLYGGGLIARRPVLARAGFRATEAVAVSGVVTVLLKELSGRARPAVSPDDPSDFQFGRGLRTPGGDYQSMSSGHAAAAFAFAAAVTRSVSRTAPEHARWVGVLTYGSALSTAYARMHDDRHWLSDVTVGAGIGVVTAWAIDRWHHTRSADPIDGFFLRPVLTRDARGRTQLGVSVQRR